MLEKEISNLVAYSRTHLLMDELDGEYSAQRICRALKIPPVALTDERDEDEQLDIDGMASPAALLRPVFEYALENGVTDAGGLAALKSELMDALMLRPSEINDLFADTYSVNKQRAFDFLYEYSVKDGYVDLDECAKNDRWEAKELKSRIEIIINLMPQATTAKYPACALCKENEGFTGRANMRTVTTELAGEQWFFTYSRHQYFDKHGVLSSAEHKPMQSLADTVKKLGLAADFVGADGFVGVNSSAVGGGAKNTAHEHFQSGFKTTPMFRAESAYKLKSKEYPYLEINAIGWYSTVIRVAHSNLEKTAEFVAKLVEAWRGYADERIANTGDKNFCNLVCRKLNGKYTYDVILRSNALKRPRLGAEYEEIKADALSLTDILGYFVLPNKLSEQLKQVQLYLDGTAPFDANALPAQTKPFAKMIERMLKAQGGTVSKLEAKLNVHDEVDAACEKILASTAIDAASLAAFLDAMDIRRI